MEVLDLTAIAGLVEEVARHGQAVVAYLKGTLLVVCCAATRAVLFVYDIVGLPFQLFGRCWDFAVEWVVKQAGGCFGDDDKLLLLEEGSLPNATGRDEGGNAQAMGQANAYGGHGPAGTVPVSPGVVQANISVRNYVSGGERNFGEPQAAPRPSSPPSVAEEPPLVAMPPPPGLGEGTIMMSEESRGKERSIARMHFELLEGEEEEASSFVPRLFGSESAARPTKWTLEYLRESAEGRCGVIVGGGSFAQVAVVHHSCGKSIAVKFISRANVDGDSLDPFIDSELTTLRKASVHPNVVDCFGYLKTNLNVYLVMPMVAADLEASLQVEALTEEKSKGYIQQLLSALEYLHDKGIIHRDLKPANMLISADDKLLLADFGVALIIPNGQTSVWDLPCGTKSYMAPELMVSGGEDAEMTSKVDMWGAGVLAFELMHGNTPFSSRRGDGKGNVEAKGGTTGTCGGGQQLELTCEDKDDDREREDIRTGRVAFSEGLLSAEAMDFISKLLEVNVDARLSAVDASEHAWLGGPDRAATARSQASIAVATREEELLAEKARQSRRRVVRRKAPARGRGGLGGGRRDVGSGTVGGGGA